MKKLLFPSLILIALVSGCTVPGTDIQLPCIQPFCQPVTEEISDVVAITGLNVLPSSAAPNQQVRLIAYIQNKGDEKIPQDDIKSKRKILINLYDYCEGMFEKIEVSCEKNKITTNGKETGCEEIELLPMEIMEIDWKMKVADLPLKTQCELKVSVEYPYKTTSLTTIYFIDYDEMQRQLEQETFKTRESTISMGEGPVKAHLTVLDQQPIPIQEGKGSSVLALEIENKGEGFTHKVEPEKDKEKKVDIKASDVTLSLPEEFTLQTKEGNCKFKEGGSPKKDFKGYQPTEDIRLIKDKSSMLICPINFDGLRVPKESSMHMLVDIEYEYEFRKSVVFKVEPKI